MRGLVLTALMATAGSFPAMAEVELSFYTGVQSAQPSRAEVSGAFGSVVDWQGRSGAASPQFGLRGTWWRSENLGFGVEFSHAPVTASDRQSRTLGFDGLGFSDGLNILTINMNYRWPDQFSGATPYVSGGVGLAIPDVGVDVAGAGAETDGLQITGPAARLTAGLSFPVTESVSVFGEYQFTYSSNDANLDGGSTFDTDIVTNAVNIGLSLNF